MAFWELDEFQGPELLAFIRELEVPNEFIASQLLPDKTVTDLRVEYTLGANHRPVMASVLGYGAEAPIAGRRGLGEKISLKLPPIKRKSVIEEEELIRFLTPRANTTEEQDAIDSVYDLLTDLFYGVHARVEWLRMKALSEDTLIYDEGFATVKFEFDYGYDDKLQINLVTQQNGAGTSVAGDFGPAWSDTANATIVEDLTAMQVLAKAQFNGRFAEIWVSTKTWGYVLGNTKIRDMIRGENSPVAILTEAEVNTVLDLYNLPHFRTYDVTVDEEQVGGSTVTSRTLAEHKAVLVPAGGPIAPGHSTVGATLWGPTAESRRLIGTPLAQQAPGIFAVVWGEDEPPAEWTKVSGVALPSIPGANRVGQMTLWAP